MKNNLINWLVEETYNLELDIEVSEHVSSQITQHPSLAILK